MNFSPFNFDDSLEIRFDDVINHNINNNQSIRHINNFFSLSRNSRGRRINHMVGGDEVSVFAQAV